MSQAILRHILAPRFLSSWNSYKYDENLLLMLLKDILEAVNLLLLAH